MSAVTTHAADDHIFHHSTDGQPLENQPSATFGHQTDWFENCTICVPPDPLADARAAKAAIAARGEVVFACRTGRHGNLVVYTEPDCERQPAAWCCGKTMRRVKGDR